MANTVSRRSIVFDILFEVEQGKKSAKEAEAALNKIQKQSSKTEDSVKKLGKAFLGAFAIEEMARKVAQFTKEAVQLAQKAEGVRKAFNALNDPNLLNNLRAATRGTVSDVQLMQAAVRAQNFKIPLEQLGKYFDFARQRARATGESVDYLVNSIIDGIGRKSTLVLDNLGLSASEIQTEFKATGDLATAVGNIIEREMGNAEDATMSAADQIEIYNASILNLKETIGSILLPTLGSLAQALNLLITKPGAVFKAFLKSGLDPATLAKYVAGINHLADATAASSEELDKWAQRMTDAFTQVQQAINPTDELRKKIALFGDDLKNTTIINVQLLEERLKEIKELFKTTDIPTSEYQFFAKAVEELEEQLKELLKVQDAQIARDEKAVELLEKKIALTRQLNKVVAENYKENEATGFLEQKLIQQDKDRAAAQQAVQDALLETADATVQLLQVTGVSSEAQLALSIVSTLASQAEAIGKGIASASSLPYPANLAAIASTVATIIGTFAQVIGLINQAKTAQSQVNRFAEGEVDIHRPGEVRGKDSIPAVIMPGESVITTDKTSRYKPFLKAIHEGTLEDLIRENYVEPALAITAMERAEKDSMVDYTPQWYRQHRTALESISINKQAIGQLKQINRKLSRKGGGWYV